MFRQFCFIFLSALLLSQTSHAQSAATVLNQKISSKPTGVTKTFSIQESNQPQFEFEIIVQNGNGLDYFEQVCTGSMLQKLFCRISNAKTQVLVRLDRPEQLEIRLNDVVIADRVNFPREKGVFVATRFLSGQQTLKSFQKGLPTSNITLRVVKYVQANKAPVARFDFSSVGDIEPSLVSFSALLSSDPDGSIVSYEWDFGDQSFATGAVVEHIFQAAGSYSVTLKVTDNRGAQNSTTKVIVIRPDTIGPVLSQINPPPDSEIEANSLVLTGESNEALARVLVQVNTLPAVEATINQTHFSASLLFSSHGAKNIKITAFDLKNNQSVTNISYSVTFNNPPLAKINILSQSSGVAPSMLWFDASTSTDPDGDQLTYLWDFGDNETSLELKPTHLFKVAGTQSVTLTVRDGFGGESSITKNFTLESQVLPVDPATVAPPLSQDLIQTNEEKFGFLYLGADAVQKDVDLTKIDELRITPIKGKILRDALTPLEGVHVSVKDHPEFGYTLTRSDGAWDLVVNGGGVLTIIFKKGGFANSLRQIDTRNNTPNTIDDILLVQIDEKRTIVQLNATTPQVHEATIVQDQDGIRRAQVLIPENTTAEIVMPDGSRRPVEQLTIRATEFSIGVDGQKRMPAALPPRSGYTYAADFTADEAIALGADSVEFSKPVPIYVDNFLNFPVGVAVPVGFLNPKSGYWEQMPDGIVLKILSVNQEEKAQLDMHGTGVVVTPAELSLLNITDSELKVIAQKFQVGQSFWRAESRHFSVIDLNANSLKEDIEPLPDDKKEKCEPCGSVAGCIINVPRQLLDEEINLKGLGYSLRYSTDRVSGRKIPNTIAIDPINSYTLNAEKQPLISAKVTVKIAGQVFVQEFNNPKITDKFEFAWDGRDGFGRDVYESQTAKVAIEYLYPDTYRLFSWEPGIYSFDTLNSNITVVLNSARAEYVLTNSFDSLVSSPLDQIRTRALKQFNGWALNNYHSYDTKQKTLYKGTGETIQTDTITSVVSTIAGNGVASSLGNFGLAVNASLNLPTAVTQDALGNIFVVEAQGHRIRKIDLYGTITRVAGNGSSANTGDGGLAIDAAIGSPRAIRVTEDGTIYFNDFLNNVTRKIDPAGIISTIAGTGIAGYSGDGGPATLAQLNGPRGLVIGNDGSIYISDSRNNVLRRIWTDGKITTYAGTGSAGFSGDNGPATEAELNFPNFTDIDEQGNIYVADTTNNRIRKISVTGIISTVGGNGITNGPSADFQLATSVSLNNPGVVKVNSRGEIYFSEQDAQ